MPLECRPHVARRGPSVVASDCALCADPFATFTCAQINLACHIAILLQLTKVCFDFVEFWYSPRLWVRIGDETSGVLFYLIIWIIARHSALGQAVMLARNGERVLTMMTAAATATSRQIAVQSVLSTLPWLPAFDRRDTMTIKMVLDVRESQS